jgi:hypothetical protein
VKPLLVGEQPSRSGDHYWEFPLSGAVAQTLCRMAGIPPRPNESRYGRWTWALYYRFHCINLIERYRPWDAALAVEGLRDGIGAEDEVVVLLGRKAQQAYVDMQVPGESVLDGLDFYEWVVDPASPTGRREVLVLPHPSALNIIYKERGIRSKAGRLLKEAIEKAKQMHETRL